MQSKQGVRLALPGDLGLDCLREAWVVDSHPQESRVLTFWDSFEWGLWFGGRVLYSSRGCYRLCTRGSREAGWLGAVLCEERAGTRRRFWRDFESEAMRSQLEGVLGLRGLQPVVAGTWRLQHCDVRNEVGKIVCRLEWSSVSAGKHAGEDLLHSCLVLPLLGYQPEAERLLEQLCRRGARRSGDGSLEALLQHANCVPQKYTLRPAFGLEMATPAREALGRIVRAMLGIAIRNVPGILQDLDTEFLHDYRICLRKMRSVLGLVRDVYPAESSQRMRKILGDLARQTNRLRDLDVYLLARDEYLGLLPPGLRPALDEMFEDFLAQRGGEVRRAAARMQAPSSRLQLREMEAYFSEEMLHGPSPAAELPVGPLVFRSIYKRYRKIREIAAGFEADTPDESVHKLRIECKKLRYLMEFFSELLPKDQGAAMQRLLRRLQGRLGEFNDASVQQTSLMSYWQRKNSGAEVALGLGGLVSTLYNRQQRTRGFIQQALQEFCDASTAATFKHTFKLPGTVPATGSKRSKPL